MSNVTRIAVVDPNDATRSALKTLMLGIDSIWLEAECSRYEFFSDVIMQSQPDIALVSLDSDSDKALALIAQLSQEVPTCNLLAVSSSQEGRLILQAMRNGAKEFLNYPLNFEDFLAALDRIKQTSSTQAGEGRTRSSQVVAVTGVCGGVGCTSLAINLACALAQNQANSVAIMDLDLALGDADIWLDVIADYTIQDVANNINRLDYSLLKRSLTKHDCGAFLLPRPVQMENELFISVEEFRRVVALLKAPFTNLVIDVSKSYGPLDLVSLELADHIIMVTQLDLPCLRNVVRLMRYYEQHEGLSEKIKIVANRLGLEDSQISLNKALETIGREIYWQIPNDYATMVESRNNGVPLITEAPRAKLTKSILSLAQALDACSIADEESADTKQRKGLFSFLSANSK